MDNKHFKTGYLSYQARLRTKFLGLFLFVVAIILYNYFTKGQSDFGLYFLMILVFSIVYSLIQFYNSRQFINEVKFLDDKMIITGYNFNSRWEAELKLADSKIEIKSKGQGRSNVEYFLRIKSKERTFDINKSFNWDYFSLLDIFHEFKRVKGEKIIFDEKYFLDILGKKANGLSSMDIAFGKEIKK